MIKMITTGPHRQPVLVVGLPFDDLRQLIAEPGDCYLRVAGATLGLPLDVVLFSGATEQECADILQTFIGPDGEAA